MKYHAMKMKGEIEVDARNINLAGRWRWVISLTLWSKYVHETGGWLDARDELVVEAKGRFFCFPESEIP
jgi:hypothetical protein